MRKALIFVLSAVFLLVLGAFISGTILTPYAQDMGATWIQIGILSGSMYAVRLFIGAPVGRLADRKGTLTVLKISLMLFPFIAAAYYFAFDINSLIGARLLHGVASAMLLPMGMAYVGQASPDGMEGRYMGLYNLCVLLASGIGPFISTIVAGVFNYRATFILLFAFAVVALLVVISLKDMDAGRRSIDKPQNAEVKRKAIDLLKDKRLLALSLANIALSVVSSLVGFFILPFLETRSIDLIFTGSIIAIYNILSGVVQLPLGKIMDKHNKFLIVLMSGVATSVVMLMFPLSQSLLTMGIAMTLTALGSAILLASTSALSVMVGRELGMGSTMGFLSTSNSIGMIFGCLSLSLMPGMGFKFESFFYLSSAVMLICTILFAVLWAKRERSVQKR